MGNHIHIGERLGHVLPPECISCRRERTIESLTGEEARPPGHSLKRRRESNTQPVDDEERIKTSPGCLAGRNLPDFDHTIVWIWICPDSVFDTFQKKNNIHPEIQPPHSG